MYMYICIGAALISFFFRRLYRSPLEPFMLYAGLLLILYPICKKLCKIQNVLEEQNRLLKKLVKDEADETDKTEEGQNKKAEDD